MFIGLSSTSFSASGTGLFLILMKDPKLSWHGRYPSITVGPNVAQILAVPIAKLMELLPTTKYTTFGYRWTLNPCAALTALTPLVMLTVALQRSLQS